MDVLFYQPWIKSKGGIERLMLEYAQNSKHNIKIVTHYLDQNFEDYDVEIEQLSNSKLPEGFMKRGLFSIPKIIKEKLELEKYDLFLVSEAGLGSFITLRNHNIPVICYCHTPLRAAHQFYDFYLEKYRGIRKMFFSVATKLYRFLEKIAWDNFELIIANSNNTLENIRKANLAIETTKKVIYPGANIQNFENNKEEKYFFYPSRFKPYKRQELAINAFKEFSKHNSDYKLVLAGFPDDKDYIERLREISGENIEIKENVSDKELKELYSRCTAVLFTAKNEDWGIVPIEAMASGKPVIAVNEGGPSESIVDEETGFLCSADVKSFAEKMTELIKDEETYQKMCDAAKERAKMFTWESFAKKLDNELENYV